MYDLIERYLKGYAHLITFEHYIWQFDIIYQ